jgi:hypothetical protein
VDAVSLEAVGRPAGNRVALAYGHRIAVASQQSPPMPDPMTAKSVSLTCFRSSFIEVLFAFLFVGGHGV